MLLTLPLCRDWEHLGDRHVPNIRKAPLLLEVKSFESSRRGGTDGCVRSRKRGKPIALLPAFRCSRLKFWLCPLPTAWCQMSYYAQRPSVSSCPETVIPWNCCAALSGRLTAVPHSWLSERPRRPSWAEQSRASTPSQKLPKDSQAHDGRPGSCQRVCIQSWEEEDFGDGIFFFNGDLRSLLTNEFLWFKSTWRYFPNHF